MTDMNKDLSKVADKMNQEMGFERLCAIHDEEVTERLNSLEWSIADDGTCHVSFKRDVDNTSLYTIRVPENIAKKYRVLAITLVDVDTVEEPIETTKLVKLD